jgi:AAA15 family ATPase/GTPase
MLIRFVLNNVLSFGKQKEFNLFPNKRLGTLKEHIYKFQDFEVLKLSAIYGANGAGKSNLIHGLAMLKYLILEEHIPSKLKNGQFKFQENKSDTPQLIAIEFMQDDITFYYGVEIKNGIVLTEELYESGLGVKEDILIYERKTDSLEKTTIKFSEKSEKDGRIQIIKEVLLQEFIKPNKPIFKLLANRDNENLKIVKKAFDWFASSLTIIMPGTKATALPQRIDLNDNFKKFVDKVMCSFNIGITDLSIEKITIEDYFGKNDQAEINEVREKIDEAPNEILSRRFNGGEELNFVKEGNQIFVKRIQLSHKGSDSMVVTFDMNEESDGTARLLDFTPAFEGLISRNKVYVIDEIERSIHPLLIKELVKKFSLDTETKGQLIFTTHESNLLDQEIFRQDEIWFAEKDDSGSTDLYSLSSFKEHKTIDIQKGYLNGRYGSIPFLGNLHDLNWHHNVTEEQTI